MKPSTWSLVSERHVIIKPARCRSVLAGKVFLEGDDVTMRVPKRLTYLATPRAHCWSLDLYLLACLGWIAHGRLLLFRAHDRIPCLSQHGGISHVVTCTDVKRHVSSRNLFLLQKEFNEGVMVVKKYSFESVLL